ncbi:MAG: hypothetical protein D3916_11730 [Candidatus Electrothrix sp. MAN1_4]|nr:hypothetical protein [Candidatus Electrothrix sp. MAN1_4]
MTGKSRSQHVFCQEDIKGKRAVPEVKKVGREEQVTMKVFTMCSYVSMIWIVKRCICNFFHDKTRQLL